MYHNHNVDPVQQNIYIRFYHQKIGSVSSKVSNNKKV